MFEPRDFPKPSFAKRKPLFILVNMPWCWDDRTKECDTLRCDRKERSAAMYVMDTVKAMGAFQQLQLRAPPFAPSFVQGLKLSDNVTPQYLPTLEDGH